MLVSVNPNTANSLLTIMDQVTIGPEVQLIAMQESKIHLDDMNAMTDRFRTAGWELSAVPCIGRGKTASCGVALLARPGFPIAPVRFQDYSIHIPSTPRMAFWRSINALVDRSSCFYCFKFPFAVGILSFEIFK